jgi:hypothetical protein
MPLITSLGDVALAHGDCSAARSGDSGGLSTGKSAENAMVGLVR